MSKIKNISVVAGAVCLALGVTANVSAADGAALYTQKLCNTCHGPDGNTPVMPVYPKLAGQNAPYLLEQVKDIRDGKRTNGMTAAMKPLVTGLSDDDAKAITDWLASQ